ncbi:MAG: c-type cytochrome [Hyphomicrobiaceae bacterium]
MKRVFWIVAISLAGLVGGYFLVIPRLGQAGDVSIDDTIAGDTKRGAYVATAAGCYTCHTDDKGKGEPFAGGRALKTPFGTIHVPNITPDKETGIGGWSLLEFKRALTAGVAPNGTHYYPAFPYTSYASMTDQDTADLKSYFDALDPVSRETGPPELFWPVSDRSFVGVWKLLNAPRKPIDADTGPAGAQISRGGYLVEVLGHCGACHTQRSRLGGFTGPPLGGNTRGPGGGKVPGLRALGRKWSADDIASYLSDGMTPDGDFVGGEMAHVIDHSTGKMSETDRAAIAAYLVGLAEDG